MWYKATSHTARIVAFWIWPLTQKPYHKSKSSFFIYTPPANMKILRQKCWEIVIKIQTAWFMYVWPWSLTLRSYCQSEILVTSSRYRQSVFIIWTSSIKSERGVRNTSRKTKWKYIWPWPLTPRSETLIVIKLHKQSLLEKWTPSIKNWKRISR